MSLYEPNAVFVYQPNVEPARGMEAIRQVMSGLLKPKLRLEMRIEKVFQADDVALVFAEWQLTTFTPESEYEQTFGKGTDIIRRQDNNVWLFVVDNPFNR